MAPIPAWLRLLARVVPKQYRAEVVDNLLEEQAQRIAGGETRARSVLWLAAETLKSGRACRRQVTGSRIRRRPGMLTALTQDVRYAFRSLRRRPGFTAAVVGVLALGLGAVTAIFSLLNSVVLRPLPFPEADRLVSIRIAAPGKGVPDAGMPGGLSFNYVDRSQTLESMAVYTEPSLLNLRRVGHASARIRATYASAAVFRVLRVSPALGRLFTDEDGQPGFTSMRWQIPVLLSHRFWATELGADPAIVGRVLTINDSPREVVGVMPESFAFPAAQADLWVLIEPSRRNSRISWDRGWQSIGRLRDGQSIANAHAELAALLQDLASRDPAVAEARPAPMLTPLKDAVIGDIGRVLWLAFGGMILLWLVACANAGGLFLARAEQRGREVAVRRALGAHGPHLARLFFSEALVVTLVAAALGLFLTKVIVATVLRLAPAELPRAAEIRIDATGVVCAVAMAIVMAGGYCALLLRHRNASLTSAIRGQRVTARRRGAVTTGAFVVPQVALALMLLAGSALMVQTSRNLVRRDLRLRAGRRADARARDALTQSRPVRTDLSGGGRPVASRASRGGRWSGQFGPAHGQ